MKYGKRARKRRPTSAKAALMAAADLIETCGLSVGAYERHGSYCVIGALRHVAGETVTHQAIHRISTYLLARSQYARGYVRNATPHVVVVDWSDNARSKRRVAAVLRKVAGLGAATITAGRS